MGVNAYRTSHNPLKNEILDACCRNKRGVRAKRKINQTKRCTAKISGFHARYVEKEKRIDGDVTLTRPPPSLREIPPPYKGAEHRRRYRILLGLQPAFFACFVIAIEWTFFYFLYKKKIFLKVSGKFLPVIQFY